jgi:hypothetical protein
MKINNSKKITSKNFDDILNEIIATNPSSSNTNTIGNTIGDTGNTIDNNTIIIDNINDNLINTQTQSDIHIINEQNQEYDTQNEQLQNNQNINHKMDLILLNNGWNDKNERITISLGENAASYKWMHEKSAIYYKTIHKILSIITIVFTTALSAETILNNNDNHVVKIFQQIITYVVTLLSVLQNFLKYEQLTEQHYNSANAFSQLYHEIQQQMCMFRRNRNNATDYVSDILKKYDSLIVNGPNIPNNVLSQFKQTFKNSDISIPDIADRIQKIEIISEPGTNFNLIANHINNTNNNTNNPSDSNLKTLNNTNEKRYGRQGLCNLQEIHNVFQIHGDISDNDIQQADEIQLKQLRNKFLYEKSNFEYNRYLKHSTETD